jgi:hypothetical protein
MTSADRNDDLSPAQEKLEWVTPKISLMEAENTDGKPVKLTGEGTIPVEIPVPYGQS